MIEDEEVKAKINAQCDFFSDWVDSDPNQLASKVKYRCLLDRHDGDDHLFVIEGDWFGHPVRYSEAFGVLDCGGDSTRIVEGFTKVK